MNSIPTTDGDRVQMLETIGVQTVDDLFVDLPSKLVNPHLDLPQKLSEIEIRRRFQALSACNIDADHYACFLGAGVYHHFIPSVVPYLAGRGEFVTPYTPYQPEISQGTLQSIFEFQSLVTRLTGMDVANASLYDGATAIVEAAVLSASATGRKSVVITPGLHPEYLEVLRTHLAGRNLQIVELPSTNLSWVQRGVADSDALDQLLENAACLIVQNPNFLGRIEDLAQLGGIAHRHGALFVVATYPIALGLLQPPSVYDADVVVAEGQSLGNELSFGGPYLGLFATKAQYTRLMPGRLVGMTTDNRGQRCYVLTLQTREQHIRRERAVSNVCTNQSLCALRATIYLSVMGKRGLRFIAEQCVYKAHYLAERVAQIKGFSLPFGGPFFNEFVMRCPLPPSELNRRLLKEQVIGGYELGHAYPHLADCMLMCTTEMNSREELERLLQVCRGVAAEVHTRKPIRPGA